MKRPFTTGQFAMFLAAFVLLVFGALELLVWIATQDVVRLCKGALAIIASIAALTYLQNEVTK